MSAAGNAKTSGSTTETEISDLKITMINYRFKIFVHELRSWFGATKLPRDERLVPDDLVTPLPPAAAVSRGVMQVARHRHCAPKYSGQKN